MTTYGGNANRHMTPLSVCVGAARVRKGPRAGIAREAPAWHDRMRLDNRQGGIQVCAMEDPEVV